MPRRTLSAAADRSDGEAITTDIRHRTLSNMTNDELRTTADPVPGRPNSAVAGIHNTYNLPPPPHVSGRCRVTGSPNNTACTARNRRACLICVHCVRGHNALCCVVDTYPFLFYDLSFCALRLGVFVCLFTRCLVNGLFSFRFSAVNWLPRLWYILQSRVSPF